MRKLLNMSLMDVCLKLENCLKGSFFIIAAWIDIRGEIQLKSHSTPFDMAAQDPTIANTKVE